MYENARMFFVALLYISFGALYALAILNIVTVGDYLDYLLAAAILWGVAMLGTVVTSV
jgi:Na+/H+ antiporter NhaA